MREVIDELLKGERPAASPGLLLPDGSATAFVEGGFSLVRPRHGKACFVDGGQACLFDSPGARVEFVRLAGIVHDGKHAERLRSEGLILVRSHGRSVEASGFGVELSLTLDAADPELRLGRERVELGRVASLARFILECRFLSRLMEEHACPGVRDGPLVANNRFEEEALRPLLSQCIGVSKTSALLTAAGGSAAAFLWGRAPEGAWAYRLGSLGEASIMVARLHAESRHAFRVDAVGDACSLLVSFSADAAFPGYPFPLVEADRLARVSHQEAEAFRTRFRAAAGSDWRALELLASGKDVHGLLDRLVHK